MEDLDRTIAEGEARILAGLQDLERKAIAARTQYEAERRLSNEDLHALSSAARAVHDAAARLNVPYHERLMRNSVVRETKSADARCECGEHPCPYAGKAARNPTSGWRGPDGVVHRLES